MERSHRVGVTVGLMSLVLSWATQAAAQQTAPVPSAAVPPAQAKPSTAETEQPAGPVFTLGDKQETIAPIKQHDGLAEGGKVEVKAESGTLSLTMTAAAAAHCWVGCHSVGGQRLYVTQPFEITSTAQGNTAAVVTLESTLKGVLRGRHKGSGCLHLAGAAVYAQSGAPTPLSLAYPPASAPSGCAFKYEREAKLPPITLPLGKYVLVADFLVQAEADGFANGHGVADFSSDDLPDAWKQEKDPFKDVDRKEFGFVVTLTAESPKAPVVKQAALRR